MHARIARAALPLALLPLFTFTAAAQESGDWLERCQRSGRGDGRQVACEERETRMAASGRLAVDGQQNGGVSVKAWDGADVLVRARIQASAPTADEARRLAGRVSVATSGGTVAASGPEQVRRRNWSVSYEIFVPRRTDLSVETQNGGISVAGVTGRMELEAMNGP